MDSRACSRVAEAENARVAAETFAKAALQYFNLAMEETRALKEEDHPAYAFWLDHLRNREVSPRAAAGLSVVQPETKRIKRNYTTLEHSKTHKLYMYDLHVDCRVV